MTEAISWYGAAAASHAGIDVVDGKGDLSRYKFVLAPLLYVVSAKQAEAIRSYVRGGGTFVAGFRLGVKDEDSQIVETPLPGLLRNVMGVELSTISRSFPRARVRFRGMLAGLMRNADMDQHCRPEGRRGAGGLYDGDARRQGCYTSHNFGKGKAVYLGARLETVDLARVLLTLMGAGDLQSSWKVQIDVKSVTEARARHVDLRAEPYLAAADGADDGSYRDRLTNTSHADTVTLEPYGVRVLTPA